MPIAAAALLLLHAALAIGAMWNASPTFDEVSHLPAGLALVATGEDRLNPEHPPLVKELAGLAAARLRPRLPLDGAAYQHADEWRFGREVIYHSGSDTMALMRAGRLPVVALSLLAALACFVWARQRFGDAAGITALAFYATSPLVLAHAGLVTTDAGATLGVVATMWLWWRATRRGRGDDASDAGLRASPVPLARYLLPYGLCGLALGAALATKFSCLLLPPMMLACDLLANGRRDGRRRLLSWGAMLVAAIVVLQLSYLSLAAPWRYLQDAQLVYGTNPPGYRYYLAGRFAERFPLYFLVAMAVKSTPVELLAMLGGLALAWRRRRERWRDDIYLWLPALGWIAAMSVLAVPIGVRYVLPAYALLFVLGSALAPALLRMGSRARLAVTARAAPGFLAFLLLAQTADSLLVFPGYLSYFNGFAGGPAAGARWLDDSNLDWGHSLYRLPRWLAARGIRHAYVLPMGLYTLPMQGPGVVIEPMRSTDWAQPRPGAYAISAHTLVRGLEAAEQGAPTDWLRRYRPADTFDGSMYLYIFPRPVGAARGPTG